MDISIFTFLAVLILLVTSVLLLVSLDWRWSIGALGLQYLGVFALVNVAWPLDLAVIKLVAGWMAASILGLARSQADDDQLPALNVPSGRMFRALAASLIVLAVLSFAPTTVEWIPAVELNQVWGAFLLIGMGLLQVGFSARPFRVVVGILTLLAGFEIIYAAVEPSALVAGLLAVITLGIALVGAYLLSLESRPESQA
ncbi:MAG: hypothetical protein DWQ07_22370 [Chloroflexi bacterium]|nr:MAG: hypothetical protein DWQ07_22370 [Chloroflexota bacterium]MBL1193894.1 hypothetical protein [Chloroflexota bacterium]NOH11188.1 hypothetical protein [Chloroflexota bacterium]